MKKILYVLLIGLFSACDSLLDVEPETLVSFDNYYKTEQDLEISLYQLQSFIHGRLLEQNELVLSQNRIGRRSICGIRLQWLE